MLVTCYLVTAQEFTSKKGIPILPEKGDYSISIDAVPFFVYIGNMFHGNATSGPPTFDFPGLNNVPMWTIQGKMFLKDNFAIRARVRLGYASNTLKNTIWDQTTPLGGEQYVDDKWTESTLNIVLGGGIEKRRGKGRVHGVYGAMANIMIGTHGNSMTYGNQLSATYPNPLSTNYPWVKDETGGYVTSTTNNRVLSDNDGLAFGFGLNGFLGVEYFFAPKMSIGGEFTWGFLIQTTGKSSVKTETLVGSTVSTNTSKTNGSFYFGVDNNNTGGAINISFYF